MPIVGDRRLLKELEQDAGEHLDAMLRGIAEQFGNAIGGVSRPITDEELGARPDAMKHRYSMLPPNPASITEINKALENIGLLLGASKETVLDQAEAADDEHEFMDRIRSGEEFMFVTDHKQVYDIGITFGLPHMIEQRRQQRAEEAGEDRVPFDRMEHFLHIVVGRALGAMYIGNDNVIDDVLRKGGSVIKTLPSRGGQAIAESDGEPENHRLLRKVCNEIAKQAILTVADQDRGAGIHMALTGEVPKADGDGRLPIQTVSGSICELLVEVCESQHGVQVVPVAPDFPTDIFDPEEAGMVSYGRPRPIRTATQVHDLAEELVEMGNKQRRKAAEQHPHIERFGQEIYYQQPA